MTRYKGNYTALNVFEIVRRQLISSDNSYQATTHINLEKRQLISSDNSYQSKLISESLFQIIHEIIKEN